MSGPRNADEAEGWARRSGKGSKGSMVFAGRFVGIAVRVQRVYAGYLQDSAAGWPFSSLIVTFEEIYRRSCKFHHIPASPGERLPSLTTKTSHPRHHTPHTLTLAPDSFENLRDVPRNTLQPHRAVHLSLPRHHNTHPHTNRNNGTLPNGRHALHLHDPPRHEALLPDLLEPGPIHAPVP